MNLKENKSALIKLQNSLYTAVQLNDALIDIIEIDFSDTGDAVYCPPHTHTWFEFNYVTSGSFMTSFGQEMQEIKENVFFLIPPGMEHSHRYNNKNPHRDITLRWQINKAHPEVENTGNSTFDGFMPLFGVPGGGCTDNGTVGCLLEQMLLHAQKDFAAVRLQMDFINILFALLDYYQKNSRSQQEGSISKYDRDMSGKTLIKKVEVYLNDNKLQDFDVHALAASMHMSYGHLARLYKKYSGQTIVDRLCSIRLEKSCMLLLQTDYTMKEIAEKLGFSNQYYFSKVFKEKNGMSPSQYRKNKSIE